MPEIAVRNWKNEPVRSLDLDASVFDYPLKKHLIYEAVLAYRAAARAGTHKVKNRVEVSGGTRKLWKQKHTGRARMGDNRSPLWRHGGTVHGPQPRDYSWKFPKRMRRNALRSALAQKLREGKLVCIEAFDLPSHKTQEFDRAVAGGLGIHGKTLMVPAETEEKLELATRNNPRFTAVRALGVSVVDVLGHDTLLFSEEALRRLSEVLAK
ncbi:MAG TPA: 50S ribosomal protein L4 [Candidatus Polarisedimenticolaceae bacterium]|nr:50S ribosomal protein L4 [Candidatus Polarisedimenticolaceae bacterium]